MPEEAAIKQPVERQTRLIDMYRCSK